MTTFDARERAFEAQFANEEELKFKVTARRDRMLGEWLGAKFGLSGTELDTYARSILKDELAHPGDEAVVAHAMGDIAARDAKITADDVRAQLSTFQTAARMALMAGT